MNRTEAREEIERLKSLKWSIEIQDQIDTLNHQLSYEIGVPRHLRLER